jgi:hypothetical protein
MSIPFGNVQFVAEGELATIAEKYNYNKNYIPNELALQLNSCSTIEEKNLYLKVILL